MLFLELCIKNGITDIIIWDYGHIFVWTFDTVGTTDIWIWDYGHFCFDDKHRRDYGHLNLGLWTFEFGTMDMFVWDYGHPAVCESVFCGCFSFLFPLIVNIHTHARNMHSPAIFLLFLFLSYCKHAHTRLQHALTGCFLLFSFFFLPIINMHTHERNMHTHSYAHSFSYIKT